MVNPHHSFVVEENDSSRLGDFLKKKLGIASKQHVGRCLRKEWATVNGQVRTEKSALLAPGDAVALNATAFEISQLRFAAEPPLLPTLLSCEEGSEGARGYRYKILSKPGGMPLDGTDSLTVENALPASMEDEHYEVIDCVGRIVSGPIVVSMDTNEVDYESHRKSLMDVPKRYTFILIVHGVPPDFLDVSGFVSLEVTRTVESTTGDFLSMIKVIMTHTGDGLRGCLRRIGFPILGTATRTKSTRNGRYFACTRAELRWEDRDRAEATVVDFELPAKFHSFLERERRFYDAKKRREVEEGERQEKLRSEYVDRMMMMGTTFEELRLSDRWSVANFCGLPFYVTDDVMTPRPSSEILIQSAREHLAKNADASILDLGTGSGCLLVSAMMDASLTLRGVGVDISSDALKVAEINIRSHGLTNRTALHRGDFGDLSFLGSAVFDVVLCNPPYLTEGECEKDKILIGPRVSLVADNGGLACYEKVARQVGAFLRPGAVAVVEVGGRRGADEIRDIFGDLDHVETRLDAQGQSRCLVLRKSVQRSK